MENEFDEIMKQHSDAELIEVLNSEPGDYVDSAMEAARREFKSRNLSAQKVKEINDRIEQQKQEGKLHLTRLRISHRNYLLLFFRAFGIFFCQTVQIATRSYLCTLAMGSFSMYVFLRFGSL